MPGSLMSRLVTTTGEPNVGVAPAGCVLVRTTARPPVRATVPARAVNLVRSGFIPPIVHYRTTYPVYSLSVIAASEHHCCEARTMPGMPIDLAELVAPAHTA